MGVQVPYSVSVVVGLAASALIDSQNQETCSRTWSRGHGTGWNLVAEREPGNAERWGNGPPGRDECQVICKFLLSVILLRRLALREGPSGPRRKLLTHCTVSPAIMCSLPSR